jgi:hypothetical protein
MNLHTELGIPAKLISYGVLQQIRSATNVDEFRKSLQESLGRVRDEATSLRRAFQTSLLDSRMRFAQVAKGSLNQYLSTPIKSDNEEVERIIKEAFEKYSEQILPTQNIGIESAWSSQLIVDSALVRGQTKISGTVRKMLSAGKRTLKEMDFKWGRNASSIFESVYLLDGGMNLDALEFLLWKSTPGDVQSSAIECSRSSLYNIIASVGDSEPKNNLWEASMIPANKGTADAGFVPDIEKAFEQLMKEFNLHQLSLWQKRLSSGEDSKFVVRARTIPDQKLLCEIVKWFTVSENESLRRSLTENGALVVKEIIA